jgi:hypothetical protein
MYRCSTVPTLILFMYITLGIQGMAFPVDPQGSDPLVDSSSFLLINELLASNSTTKVDPQGEYDDWIELVNRSDSPIDLAGMYLTDDPDRPQQWRFPAASTIAAHGYLVVWLDNDTHADGLHASFKLNAQGDSVALFAADGITLIDQVDFRDQDPDVSQGRYPDASAQWTHMGNPTPGTENVEVYSGFVEQVSFSQERGFHEVPFSLSLSTQTNGATIEYTLDGKDPAGTPGGRHERGAGLTYQGPIPISSTTCVRAIAYKPGWKTMGSITHTYLFLDQVAQQGPGKLIGFPGAWGSVTADYEMDPEIVDDPLYADQITPALESLPSLSIAMDVEDLFGANGIYTNSGARGLNWERPASAELTYPNGAEGFQINCGIRIQGGYFRSPGASPKHSFRLLFKGMYGSSKLRYPLFGPDAADEFDTITLRAGANDAYTWNAARGTEQYTRDQFARDLQRDTGQASPHGMFVHLYVNGLYWGLYNPVERPDGAFSASYYGGEKEDWDVFSHKGFARNQGEQDALSQMRSECQAAADSFEAFQRLQGRNPDGTAQPDYPHLLDLPNYIDYMIVNDWTGNWDWPWNNYWLARKRTADSTGFKFYCWDTEDIMGSPRSSLYIDKIVHPDARDVGQFHVQLSRNPEYRLLFADRLHRLLFNSGILTPNALIERYTDLAQAIELAMLAESARWGDQHHHAPVSMPEWYNMRDWILQTYLPQRSSIVLQQFREAGLYPDLDAPVFNISGSYQHGGHIAATDTLSMTAAGDAIWYTLDGSDPRIPGKSGPIEHVILLEEEANKRIHVPTAEVEQAWRSDPAFDDAHWTAGSGGVGYELGAGFEDYFTVDLFDRMFFMNASCLIRIPFELTQNAAHWAALTLRVRFDDGFVAYLNGREVARAQAPDQLQWNSGATGPHHDSEAVEFTDFNISAHINVLRTGQNILAVQALNNQDSSTDFLFSAEMTGIASASLANTGISPGAIEYKGPVVLTESRQVSARAFDGNQWSPLNQALYAVGPVAESLRISELMYHPDMPNTEFIELINVGTESINLNRVAFSTGIDFVFDALMLTPGDIVLVAQDTNAFIGRYGSGLCVVGQYTGSLSNGGEQIRLQDAAGLTIQTFVYDDAWYASTDGQGLSLTVNDPLGTASDTLSDPSNWHPSRAVGGSAGY